MPRITIDIEGFAMVTPTQPNGVGYTLVPTQPTTNIPAAPAELLSRAQAIGALNAGPAPSVPGISLTGPAPSQFTSPGAVPDSEARAMAAGPAPESVFRDA
jgi:hypothetical protein